MIELVLGVVDLPYSDPSPPKRVARPRKGRKTRGRKSKVQTTGDVATILEAKYGVMAGFYELHGQEIVEDLTEAMAEAIESLVSGAPVAQTPLAGLGDKVQERFKDFLDREELAGVVAGVPTQAAVKGVSHRRRHPYAKGNPRRPSFVDTGLYESSMVAWVEGA